MKTTCLQKDYDINFAPNDGGIQNQLNLQFELENGKLSSESLVRSQALLNPTINSWRKTKALSMPIDEIISQQDGSVETSALLSPDINMYLAMSQLMRSFNSDASKSTEITHFANSYEELIQHFAENELLDKEAHSYYLSLFQHEWKEFLESTNFEMGRIY